MYRSNHQIILASSSPRRIELLQALGVNVRVEKPDVPEFPRPGEAPSEYVQRLAEEKGRKVLGTIPTSKDPQLIVSADTIVTLGQRILEKPSDHAAARDMLAQLAGRTHTVFTGMCCLFPQRNHLRLGVFTTEVEFRELTPEEIAAYVATGEPMDKAGAYGIQGFGGTFIRSIRGSYSNVMGLPISALVVWLLEEGALQTTP